MDEAALRTMAEEMIVLFGADAAAIAGRRADRALDQGDVNGSYMWKRIVDAIHDIAHNTPPATREDESS